MIDKDKTNPLPRDPISGYVMQPLNSDTTSYNLSKTFYIYDIEVVQEFERGVTDGIYYITLLCASIAPSTSNFNNRKFSQNVNEVYPTFDRDNPVADPSASISVADNETIGLVYSTDGATPTPNKDPKRSITKEAIQFLLSDTGWTQPGTTPNYDSVNATLSSIELTARSGDEEGRKINIRENNDGTVAPINVEFRRHSILRSGNHTFEYLGFGPGNYSTAFPQTQVETLSSDQVKFSQSIKEEAGVAFYSGLNSNGDLFIGNTRISSVTGEEESLDTPVLSVVGETANLRPTFDEIIVRDKITVESNTLTTEFKGKFLVQGETTVNDRLTAADVTIGITGESSKNIDVVATSPGSASANDGDWKLREIPVRGQYLGWYWTGAEWVKFGLTDTGNLNISGGSGNNDATGDLQLKNGLGIDIQNTGTLNVNNGATTLGSTLSVSDNATFSGNITVTGSIITPSGTSNLLNGNATTVNIAGAATTLNLGATTGTTDIRNNLDVGGDLDVEGGQISVAGQQVLSDNGSGTTTLQRIDALDATTEATIESAIDTLGNLTSASSLNTVGTIGTGTWQASIINRAYGGTGINTSSISNGQLLIGSSSGFALSTVTAGNGISVTNAANSITIANTGVRSLAVSNSGSSISLNASTGALTLTFGSSSNAYGTRTISTNAPSGGSNGDVWYRY